MTHTQVALKKSVYKEYFVDETSIVGGQYVMFVGLASLSKKILSCSAGHGTSHEWGTNSPGLLPSSWVDDFMLVGKQYPSKLCQNSNNNQIVNLLPFWRYFMGQSLPLPFPFWLGEHASMASGAPVSQWAASAHRQAFAHLSAWGGAGGISRSWLKS